MRNSPDYITGYADGKRAGLLGVSRCMTKAATVSKTERVELKREKGKA